MSPVRCFYRCGLYFVGTMVLTIQLAAQSSGSVSFLWNANSEADLAGYNLYVGNQTRIYSQVVNVGLVTNYALTGLSPGSTYYFALTAFNTAGLESDFTPELSYQVPVVASNALPTLDPIADFTLPEDAGQYVVSLSGITSGNPSESQPLTVTAVSSNPGLIRPPTVNYSSPAMSGSLVMQPVQNAFGTATITVTVDDAQPENNRISRSFSVTVLAVNDSPYFNPLPDIVLSEGASDYYVQIDNINSGAANESDPLTLTATSSQPEFIPHPEITYTSPATIALLALRPVGGSTGTTATITVTLTDGQPQNGTFTRNFLVTMQKSDSFPVISPIADQIIAKNWPSNPITFTVSDAETPTDSLQVSATSSNVFVLPASGLLLGGSGNDRTLTLDPLNGRAGMTTVTVTVSDGASTASMSFQVTVDNR